MDSRAKMAPADRARGYGRFMVSSPMLEPEDGRSLRRRPAHDVGNGRVSCCRSDWGLSVHDPHLERSCLPPTRPSSLARTVYLARSVFNAELDGLVFVFRIAGSKVRDRLGHALSRPIAGPPQWAIR